MKYMYIFNGYKSNKATKHKEIRGIFENTDGHIAKPTLKWSNVLL